MFHWAVHTLAAAPEKGTVTHIQGVGGARAQSIYKILKILTSKGSIGPLSFLFNFVWLFSEVMEDNS